MFDREKLASTIKDAADKAGALVVAALTVASCALVISLIALVIAVGVRHASKAG